MMTFGTVSIGPRGSRGWWRVVGARRFIQHPCFNRAARFARLVAAINFQRSRTREWRSFNRAARFARLVAGDSDLSGPSPELELVSIGPRGSRGWWHERQVVTSSSRANNVSIGPRGSRGWWLPESKIRPEGPMVWEVSIGPRGSRGWWPGMGEGIQVSRDQASFNRAARFARLVADLDSLGAMAVLEMVSIGPRGSRGWWHWELDEAIAGLAECFNRAARFARLVAGYDYKATLPLLRIRLATFQ